MHAQKCDDIITKKVKIGPHFQGAVGREKTNPTLIGVRHAFVQKQGIGISQVNDCKYRNTQLFSQEINLMCYDDGLLVEISYITVIE